MGIPEPPRLDPLCGAAALAQSLKTLGKPYDKQTLLAHVRVTGRGSRLGDILAGARKMGLSARIVTADDKGLIALPKPLVAYVEHDHFLSVLQADKQGVSYLCSDCGAWPGGKVRLTWQQWHKLEATLYGVITRPNSAADTSLTRLQAEQQRGVAGIQVASLASLALPSLVAETPLLRRMRRHVQTDCGQTFYWPQNNPNRQQAGCGYAQNGLKCYCIQQCAKDCGGSGAFGAQAGDPINLATGEEEYTPGPDLVVYNPLGPSVSWSRLYDSLRPTQNGTQSYDLGQGWSHTYNIGVYDTNSTQTGGGGNGNARTGGGTSSLVAGYMAYLMEPNGARVALQYAAIPSATQTRVPCTVQAGFPLLAEVGLRHGHAQLLLCPHLWRPYPPDHDGRLRAQRQRPDVVSRAPTGRPQRQRHQLYVHSHPVRRGSQRPAPDADHRQEQPGASDHHAGQQLRHHARR